MIVNKLQKAIYDCLKGQSTQNFNKLVGIFNYIDKNTDFPYLFISINKITDLSNFVKTIYDFEISINIFDRNSTNSFLFDISEEIKIIFANIYNINGEGFDIMDIRFKDFNVEQGDNGSIWKGILNFNFIVGEI